MRKSNRKKGARKKPTTHDMDRLKRLAVVALFSDDELVGRLVLKGGNALSLAHNLATRASFDLDFSMEGQFERSEFPDLIERIERRLKQAFMPVAYFVFDVRLEPKPENVSPDLQDFWGGYALEFKLISQQRHDELCGDVRLMQREAVPSRPGGKARIEIDISSHEYCSGKQPIKIDGFTVYVYTPTMIVAEKLRAICQQTESYAQFVNNHQARRARDFFDICNIISEFGIDMLAAENVQLIRDMFGAKRVPLQLLMGLEQDREFHRPDWQAVQETVDSGTKLDDFDVYFDRVVALAVKLAKATTD